jgi:hypothetical protein
MEQQNGLVIVNEDGFFIAQVKATLNTLRATLEILQDMHDTMLKAEQDREIIEQSERELQAHQELINYWELLLRDNGVEA